MNRAADGYDHHMARTRIILFALLVAGALLSPTAPLSAHAVLTGTQPSAGSTVEEPVPNVRLEFSEAVQFPRIDVAGPAGQEMADGPPLESGDIVEQPLIALAETGEYTVTYRVTSEDDHPIEGTFTFDYQGPVEEIAPDAVATPAPETTTDPQTVDGGQAAGEETAAGGEGTDWRLPALLALAVLALGAGAVVALRRRSDEA
jgi:copper resistance protein C